MIIGHMMILLYLYLDMHAVSLLGHTLSYTVIEQAVLIKEPHS